MNRVLCTTLLLIVIFAYAIGTAHAAAHVTVDPGDCALCATYGGSDDAIPGSGPPLLPISDSCDVADLYYVAESSSAVAEIRPRGPPRSI